MRFDVAALWSRALRGVLTVAKGEARATVLYPNHRETLASFAVVTQSLRALQVLDQRRRTVDRDRCCGPVSGLFARWALPSILLSKSSAYGKECPGVVDELFSANIR